MLVWCVNNCSPREKVVKFLQSNPVQIVLCVIVLLDAVIVIAQILLDLSSVKRQSHLLIYCRILCHRKKRHPSDFINLHIWRYIRRTVLYAVKIVASFYDEVEYEHYKKVGWAVYICVCFKFTAYVSANNWQKQNSWQKHTSVNLKQTHIRLSKLDDVSLTNITRCRAIARWTTARCALYMGALKIFGSSWLRPRQLLPKFLMGFCSEFWSILWMCV